MEEEKKYPMVEQPSNFKLTLLEHQRTSIYLMENLEKNKEVTTPRLFIPTNIGVYSDEAGYGKTMSLLGLISRDNYQLTKDTRYLTGLISYSTPSMMKKIVLNKTLIICPLSIILQWKNEIKKTNLSYIIIKTKKSIEEINLEHNNSDIILISPTMYNTFAIYNNKYIWKRFIIDEPDSLSIGKMNDVTYGFLWLVSSTFITRINELSRLSKHAHFIGKLIHDKSNHLRHFVIENPLEYIKQSINLPEPIEVNHNVKQSAMVNAISDHVPSEVRDMLHAGDMEGALEYLGGKSDENIMEVLKTQILKRIEKIKREISYQRLNIQDDYHVENSKSIIIQKEKRIENLEKDIENLDEKFKEIMKSDCPICYCSIEEKPVLVPCCQNVYCGGCILEWLKNKTSCPTCRAFLEINKLIFIEEGKKEESKKPIEVIPVLLSKEDKLYQIILEGRSKNKKWIIFTGYENLLTKVSNILSDFKCSEIKGSSTQRNNLLKKFKKGEIDILLLNVKFNGAGINIQCATDIILYNQLSPSQEYQGIRRAQRIGRSESVYIHRFIDVM
jgi:SNF2 family DNA or RNA helicase